MSDYNGGLTLDTRSHDLREITVAAIVATAQANGPYIVKAAQEWTTE
jgi:hypothetical protein